MNRLEATLHEVTSFLSERGVRYMVIGGFANLFWGVERFTRDLDLTIEVRDAALDRLVEHLQRSFQKVRPDAAAFARRNHLIQVESRTGVPIDLILAVLPYQVGAIDRAVEVALSNGSVRLCTAEDLIIHKLASDRPQDALDVEGLILRQHSRLDRAYLEPRIRDLAAGLGEPAILDRFHRLLEKARSQIEG